MTAISEIVSVTTSLSARVATSVGFGTPIVLGAHSLFVDKVRSYSRLSELLADGFVTTDAIYRAVAAILAQDTTVETVKVGKLATGLQSMVLTLTPTVQTQGVYGVTIDGVECLATPALSVDITEANETAFTVTIDGEAYAFTSDASATDAEIAAGLIALINADTSEHGVTASGTGPLILTPAAGTTPTITVGSGLTVAANTATEICNAIRSSIQASSVATVFAETGTSTVILTAATAGATPEVEFTTNLTAQNTTPAQTGSGFATDLAAISAEDDDWYGAVLTGYGKAEILDAVVYFETTKRILFAVTGDQDVISTAYATGDDSSDDIATRLLNNDRERVRLFWTRRPGKYPNAAETSGLAEEPGDITFAFKSLSGISADTLSSTETSRLLAKNVNFMMNTAGLTFTSNNGVMSNGLYTDLRILVDYFDARIQERILTTLQTAKKVAYTDAGIAAIKGAILSFLKGEETRGTIVEGTSAVTVPRRVDVSDADLAARFLDDVRYSCTAAGAIHKVDVDGDVSQ